ncbi:MAG: hypothetical protein ACOYNL_10130 [Rickettsiales bacterium]
MTPLMEAWKVALPFHASWLSALEQELFNFPDVAHDDQVDAVSQYLNWVQSKAKRWVCAGSKVVIFNLFVIKCSQN